MNESSNKRPVIVGLFVFLGLLFLLGGILMVGNIHATFKSKMTVVSLFDDVSGLQKGNNVWFSGVKIGFVSNLQFYGKSQVKVSMKIETKAQQYIRQNAKVKIYFFAILRTAYCVLLTFSRRTLPEASVFQSSRSGFSALHRK